MITYSHSDLFADHGGPHDEQTWSGPMADPNRTGYRGRLVYWMLCIYTGTGGMPGYTDAGNPRQNNMASFMGVPELANPQCNPQEVIGALFRAQVRASAHHGPSTAMPPIAPCSMRTNIEWLASTLGLSPVEQDIFEMLCAIYVFRQLRVALELWGEMMESDVINAVSVLLRCTRTDVEVALRVGGRLRASGLVVTPVYSEAAMHQMLRVPRKLIQRLAAAQSEPGAILSNLVVPLSSPKLMLSDFVHMQPDTDLAVLWLQGSLGASKRQEPAGHLLVSGSPGLGKTEWVRAILAAHASYAREMVVVDEMGKALSGHDRLNHLRIAMVTLERCEGAAILFDEADDVFNTDAEFGSGSGNSSSSEDSFGVSMVSHRAILNRLIEESRIPVIWIMNRPEVLDPAVLRRFDAVIAFRPIPRSARMSMIQRRLGAQSGQLPLDVQALRMDGLQDTELQQWAAIESLTPALVDRLATLRNRAAQVGLGMNATHCRHWIGQRLPGKDTKHLRNNATPHAFQGAWSADFVNASEDLQALIKGLGHTGSGRVLLYGPPGTGKTAYAHALARQIDRPLLEYRASSLLSPYVGETEERISQAFDVASHDNAVLFLDEVDSLLASRDLAVRTWEVSQVNELLEQLGDFEGVVVLATNRLDALDSAVLRRMDAKIEFSAMTPAQVQLAFAALCQILEVQATGHDQQRAAAIKELSPGDFACVARKLRFKHGERNPQVLTAMQIIVMLQDEARFKPTVRRSIGFHAGGMAS